MEWQGRELRGSAMARRSCASPGTEWQRQGTARKRTAEQCDGMAMTSKEEYSNGKERNRRAKRGNGVAKAKISIDISARAEICTDAQWHSRDKQ